MICKILKLKFGRITILIFFLKNAKYSILVRIFLVFNLKMTPLQLMIYISVILTYTRKMIERIFLQEKLLLIILITFFFFTFCPQNTTALSDLTSGNASFYNKKFNGRKTSSGERLDNKRFTAAHPSIPFGTLVRVTNKSNGKSVVVKVNDRFYPGKGHLIDLTYAAAQEIDMIRQGIAKVTIEILDITEMEAEAEAIIPLDTITYKISENSFSLPVVKLDSRVLVPLNLK